MYVSRTDSAYIYHRLNDGLHIICCKKLPCLIIKLPTLEYIQTTERRKRERERNYEYPRFAYFSFVLHFHLIETASNVEKLFNLFLQIQNVRVVHHLNLRVFILSILEKNLSPSISFPGSIWNISKSWPI